MNIPEPPQVVLDCQRPPAQFNMELVRKLDIQFLYRAGTTDWQSGSWSESRPVGEDFVFDEEIMLALPEGQCRATALGFFRSQGRASKAIRIPNDTFTHISWYVLGSVPEGQWILGALSSLCVVKQTELHIRVRCFQVKPPVLKRAYEGGAFW